MPKVLHLLSGDLWGGREAQVLLQLQALSVKGWHAEVLAFNAKETASRIRDAGIPVLIAEEAKGIPALLKAAAEAAGQARPAILVSHGYKEAFVAWRLKKALGSPWVATFHGASEGYRGIAALKKWLYQQIHCLLSRKSADAVVTVSSALGRQLGFAGLPKHQVILNVAAPGAVPPAAMQQDRRALPSERYRIIVLGRLVPVKRVDRAIAAFCTFASRNNTAELLIVGDGPLRASLERLASNTAFSPRISFLGKRNNVLELIDSSDLLLISSDSEGIPTVLLEAISRSLPVVSTDVGGIREVLGLLPGYPASLVPLPAAPGALSDAIESLSGQNRAAPEFEALFKKYFSPEVAADKHIALYTALLEGGA